jgi:hypothetical protein
MSSLKQIVNKHILKFNQKKKIKFLKYFNYKLLTNKTYNYFYKLNTKFNNKKNLIICLIYMYSNININLLYKKKFKVLLTKKFNLLVKFLELRIDVIICKLFFCTHIKYSKLLINAQTIYLNNIPCKKIIICNIFDHIQINTYIKNFLFQYFVKIAIQNFYNLSIKQIKFTSKITKNFLEIDFKILKTIILRLPYYTEITNSFLSLKKNYTKIIFNNLKYIFRLY